MPTLLSTRSLQRQLKEEGTNFKDLLADTRKALAVQYLREPQRSIAEIAYTSEAAPKTPSRTHR